MRRTRSRATPPPASEEDRHVHRLPRHPALPGELPRGLQGADDRRPEREVHRRPRSTAYRKGERKHPTMRAIAGSLTDQDIADVAAYYEQLGSPAGDAGARRRRHGSAAAARRGRRAADARPTASRATAPTSTTPIDPSYPKLAGQHADYLFVALKAYQTDHNPLIGRNNAIMIGHGHAVHARRDQGDRRLPRLAAGRPEDRPAVALPLGHEALRRPRGPVRGRAGVRRRRGAGRCAGPARATRRRWTRIRRTSRSPTR